MIFSFSFLQHGNTVLHEAAKWGHVSTTRVLVDSYCRINMRNHDGHTPMDVAHREGYGKVATELSSLGVNAFNSSSFEDSCGCNELRKLLLSDKSTSKSDVGEEKLKWLLGAKEKAFEKMHRVQKSDTLCLSRSWDEKLRSARAEIKSKYESRIAEIETRYQKRVDAMIQCQGSSRCSVPLGGQGRKVKNPEHERSPSAPDPKTFSFFGRIPAIIRTDSV